MKEGFLRLICRVLAGKLEAFCDFAGCRRFSVASEMFWRRRSRGVREVCERFR